MEATGTNPWSAFSTRLHVNAAHGPAQAFPLGVGKPLGASKQVRASIREISSANDIVKLGQYVQTGFMNTKIADIDSHLRPQSLPFGSTTDSAPGTFPSQAHMASASRSIIVTGSERAAVWITVCP